MFNLEAIILNCALEDKEAIIHFLAQQAQTAGYVSDPDAYAHAVLERESEYSTGVGMGVAIPHGKSTAVNESFIMFTRVNSVDWNSLDASTVDLVFLIGVPESDTGNEHLRLLALLARKIMNEDFRNALRSAQSREALQTLFTDYGLA